MYFIIGIIYVNGYSFLANYYTLVKNFANEAEKTLLENDFLLLLCYYHVR